MIEVREVARLHLPTIRGEFDTRVGDTIIVAAGISRERREVSRFTRFR